jgi:hypothetical protein
MKEAMEKAKEKKEHAKKIKAMIQQIETRGKKKKNILDIQNTIVTPTWITKTHTELEIKKNDPKQEKND